MVAVWLTHPEHPQPLMLRAALAASELVDGAVRGRSPHLDRVLRIRYAREVGELLLDLH